jgi:hypothetical protein
MIIDPHGASVPGAKKMIRLLAAIAAVLAMATTAQTERWSPTEWRADWKPTPVSQQRKVPQGRAPLPAVMLGVWCLEGGIKTEDARVKTLTWTRRREKCTRDDDQLIVQASGPVEVEGRCPIPQFFRTGRATPATTNRRGEWVPIMRGVTRCSDQEPAEEITLAYDKGILILTTNWLN